MYIHSTYVRSRCALPSRFIKEHNKVSTASAYCREHRRARHGWFQRWLIVEGISIKAEKTGKRKQRQSASEGIIKSKEHAWWCRAATCQTTATYGKPQSPWNWKTKVPASDKHYWLASFGKHLSHTYTSLIHRPKTPQLHKMKSCREGQYGWGYLT